MERRDAAGGRGGDVREAQLNLQRGADAGAEIARPLVAGTDDVAADAGRHVRYWPLADILLRSVDVCFRG